MSILPPSVPPEMRSIVTAAADAEMLASDINHKRKQLIDLDRRRQQTMEALAAFRPQNVHKAFDHNQSWVCMSDSFIQLPLATTKAMLENDRDELNEMIEYIRNEVKQLIMNMQRFRPSELDPTLVDFALRQSMRMSDGKEWEEDEKEIFEDEFVE